MSFLSARAASVSAPECERKRTGMAQCLEAPLLPGGACPCRKLTASKSVKIRQLELRLAAKQSTIVARLQLCPFFVRVPL